MFGVPNGPSVRKYAYKHRARRKQIRERYHTLKNTRH